MAVAAKTWTASYGPYVRLRITAQEVEVDVPNNRSKVKVTGQIYYNGGTSSSNAYSQTYTVTVNGTQAGKQTGITYSLSSGGTKNLTTYTSGWITHNSDGAKTVTVKGHITDGHGDTGSISQSYALTKIARASTLNSFSMPNSLNWSTANTISLGITRRSTSFTHDITLRDGDTNIASWTGQGVPTTLTLTAAQVNTLLTRTAGSATRSMTLRVQTKSGSTNIGSVLTRTATASISSSARASVINSFSMPNHMKPGTQTTFNLGLTRRSSSFTHDISLRDGSTVIASWTGQGLPTTRTLTAAQTNTLLSRMSSSTSRTMTLRVQTKSGSTNIGGALTRTATVYVHADVKPSVSALSVTIEGNAHAKNNVKRFVQGISRVSGKFTRSANGGATISSSKLEIRRVSGGSDLQTINSNSGTFSKVVALSGPYQARGTATDSRGRSNNTGWVNLSNFDVLAYSAPQITRFTADRKTGTPTTVDIRREGNHSGLSGKNVLTIKLQKRASGTSTWSNVAPDVTTTNAFSLTVPSTGHSVAASYDFRLYIVDQFGNSAEQLSSVTTQRVVLDVHKNEGVGIGKIHERGDLDINGNMYLDGFFSISNADSPTSEIRMVSSTPEFGNAGIELTSNKPGGTGVAYIDFNTTRNTSDSGIGDARIRVTGGSANTDYGGDMSLMAGKLNVITGSSSFQIDSKDVAEFGNRTNGSFVKFYNGVMICWIGELTGKNNLQQVEGNSWRANSVTWTFPVKFASRYVFVSGQSYTWHNMVTVYNISDTDCRVIEHAFSANKSGDSKTLFAIGRWL